MNIKLNTKLNTRKLTFFEVYAHIIGTEQSQDILVYEEPDDTVFVDITSTKDNVISI